MFPLPLQLDNDLLSPDDAAEGTLDYGRMRGRRFRGIIDFGDFTTDPTQAEAGWQAEFQSQLLRGASPEAAASIASVNWPYASSAKNSTVAVAVARDIAAGLQAKAAQDAALKAKAVEAATQAAKIGTDTADLAARQAAARETAARNTTAVVSFDPRTGQPVTVSAQPATLPGSSNTGLYIGAAAVLLGLGFVAMKRKNRGSLGGYRRRRKSRKSRR